VPLLLENWENLEVQLDRKSAKVRFVHADGPVPLSVISNALELGETGIQLVGDGTAALPGLAFVSEPSTGVFRLGGGVMAFSVLGTEYLRIVAGAVELVNAAALFPVASGGSDLGSSTNEWNAIYGRVLVAGANSNPATSGAVRLQFGGAIQSRNAAGNGNLIMLRYTGADSLEVGDSGVAMPVMGLMASAIAVPGFSAVATAGLIRVPNNPTSGIISARNQANTLNRPILSFDGGDLVNVWDSRSVTQQVLRTKVADATGHMGANEVYWSTA
jgi:hypothetical protein